MSVEVFVDVNLLYSANTHSPDPCHARARDLAESLWTDPGRAAISARAPLLWSEDLVDGQRFDDVRIVNPLRTQ